MVTSNVYKGLDCYHFFYVTIFKNKKYKCLPNLVLKLLCNVTFFGYICKKQFKWKKKKKDVFISLDTLD